MFGLEGLAVVRLASMRWNGKHLNCISLGHFLHATFSVCFIPHSSLAVSLFQRLHSPRFGCPKRTFDREKCGQDLRLRVVLVLQRRGVRKPARNKATDKVDGTRVP